MSPIVWIAIIVVAAIVVGAIAWYAGQRRRSSRLRDQFGPEYDRAVETAGGTSRAERELEARQDRVNALEIRPLDEAEGDRYRERWLVVQALFVDDPASALGDADTLIGDVMRARGYPVGDFEQRAADVSVNHPEVVEHYRTAHAIATTQRNGVADTEQLRQAMVHYRALVVDLLDLPPDEATTSPAAAANPSAAAANPSSAAATPSAAGTPTTPATTTTPTTPTTAPTQPVATDGTRPAGAPSGVPRRT
jgi:hypothetical protein